MCPNDKCECGKSECDCKKVAQTKAAQDAQKVAWVHKNCKFAEAPLRPSFIRDDIDSIKSPAMKPWTPSALESDSDFYGNPEDPQSTQSFMNDAKSKLAKLLERAQYELSKVGEQMPVYKMDNPYGNYGSGTILKSILMEAAEQAKALEMFSHHNRQQTPAESARLGSGTPSVKNAAPKNAEALNAEALNADTPATPVSKTPNPKTPTPTK